MADTIYGEVNEERVSQQEKELQEFSPRVDFGVEKETDLLEMEKQSLLGNAYMKNDSFFVAGNAESLPLTQGTRMMGQRQGYKVHVSAHPEHAATVAKAVLPLFREGGSLEGTYHKYQDLKSYTYGDIDNEVVQMQRGKFITIYAKDEETLKDIASKVQNALVSNGITQEMGGGLSQGDAQLGGTGLMSMRYGQFMGGKSSQVYVDGKFIDDDRSKCCPEDLTEEFTRVLEDTENHMEQNKVGLGRTMPKVGTSNSNTNNTNTTTTTTSTPPQIPPRPLPKLITPDPSTSSSVRDMMKMPPPRPIRRDLLKQSETQSISELSPPLPTRPPRPQHQITETTPTTSLTLTEPLSFSSKPPQYPPPLPPKPNNNNSQPPSKSQETVGEKSGIGERLGKNKRHAIYEKDSSELTELLKKEEEKEGEKKEKSVTTTKDSLGQFRGGPHHQPPDGGQGGTGVRLG